VALKQNILKLSLSLMKRKPKDDAPLVKSNEATPVMTPVMTPAVVAPISSAPVTNADSNAIPQDQSPLYRPPFHMLDRQAKIERMQQWREMKKQMCEQKKAAKMENKMETKMHKHCHRLQRGEQESQRALARFVKDVGVEEGAQLAPSTKFTKIWRFRNEGSVAWPQGSKLLFISWKGGDKMNGPDSVPVPTTVNPGSEVDISVELTAPAANGRYAGHYRLCTPEGKKFGDRVRNLIFVADPSSSTQSSSEEEVDPKYVAGVAQLEQMGFHNKRWNAKILKKFDGDINKAIRKLVRKQKKVERKHYHH